MVLDMYCTVWYNAHMKTTLEAVHVFTREPSLRLDLVKIVEQVTGGPKGRDVRAMPRTFASTRDTPNSSGYAIPLYLQLIFAMGYSAVSVLSIVAGWMLIGSSIGAGAGLILAPIAVLWLLLRLNRRG